MLIKNEYLINTCMNKIYYVYALIDPTTNLPFYIGKGKHNRMNDHFTDYNALENNKKHNKINNIRSTGKEPFAIKLFENLNENDAYDIETSIIIEYGREDIDPGGILTNNRLEAFPPIMTTEVREKISDSRKGIKFSSAHKKKLSIAKKGKTWEEIFGNTGANKKRIQNSQPKGPMSESRKTNISRAKKGNSPSPIWTEESRKKLSNSTKGIPKSIEFSNKLKEYSKIEKQCPYCGTLGSGPSMQRWHFKNCKKYVSN